MAPNNQRDSLLKVRNSMLVAFDRKFKNDPNWRAFRDLDQIVIDAFKTNGAAAPSPAKPRQAAESPNRGGRPRATGDTMGDLGVAAVTEAAKPITTDALVAYIAARRALNRDPKRARVNVQSAMSHEDRIISIKWRGGSAWWLADREVPTDTAE